MGLIFKATGLRKLAKALDNQALRAEVERIPARRAVAAIVAQAIADNFEQEGPGWEPLKASTIRYSLAKKMRKRLADMDDEDILRHEKKVRKTSSEEDQPFRKILRKTNLLYRTVTTPGYTGSSKNGQSGANIYRYENGKLIWGTDLVYAAVHNKGNTSKGIPQREFLVLRKQWQRRLTMYMLQEYRKLIKGAIKGGTL